MKHRSGFALYGFVFSVTCISLLGTIYLINLRANEVIYYRELSKQRTKEYNDIILCSGSDIVLCGGQH